MRHSVRIGTTALGFALAALTAFATFGGAGCTVTTTDTTDSGTGDDTGTSDDSATTDTNPGDDANPTTTGSIRVKATDLLTNGTDPTLVKDFGAGSTYDEITHLRIAYAKATITSGPTGVGTEFPSGTAVIGKDASDNPVDGTIDGLAPGAYQITVKGYLRGVIGDLAATPDTRILIAETTCTASVSAGAETAATCSALSIADASGNLYAKGIIFPSDFLGPNGGAAYKATTSGADLDVWRARTPTSGTAVASVAESDPEGVIFIDESKFIASESQTTRETIWSISIEPKTTSTPACTTAPGCHVDRVDGSGSPLDLLVVDPTTGDHANCIATDATTGTNACFQP